MTTHTDPLRAFITSAQDFPMLTRKQEQALARAWRENGDLTAARALATSHLKLVIKIASGFLGYGLPLADLVQEGSVGLMEAVERFNPKRKVRFSTYCIWWIKAPIYEYVLRSVSIVRMGTTAANKRLFFKLRKLKARLQAYGDGDLGLEDVTKISHILGVSKGLVINMNRRLVHDESLNDSPRDNKKGEDFPEYQDLLVDESSTAEEILIQKEQRQDRLRAMCSALNVLNDREKRIFVARRLTDGPLTLETLAQEFGISRERVRQIEVRAFKKVKSETYRKMKDLNPRRGSLATPSK